KRRLSEPSYAKRSLALPLMPPRPAGPVLAQPRPQPGEQDRLGHRAGFGGRHLLGGWGVGGGRGGRRCGGGRRWRGDRGGLRGGGRRGGGGGRLRQKVLVADFLDEH